MTTISTNTPVAFLRDKYGNSLRLLYAVYVCALYFVLVNVIFCTVGQAYFFVLFFLHCVLRAYIAVTIVLLRCFFFGSHPALLSRLILFAAGINIINIY